jgi:hypothetical protein
MPPGDGSRGNGRWEISCRILAPSRAGNQGVFVGCFSAVRSRIGREEVLGIASTPKVGGEDRLRDVVALIDFLQNVRRRVSWWQTDNLR